ncbi:MAG TPA: FliH/SctL family protein [Candidatus Hydrogenedentes bacterium]|nr:FliH/SctL family protein [Candidatus Hydrogenedentota bacterium]
MMKTAKVIKPGGRARVDAPGLEEFPAREPVRLGLKPGGESAEELDPQALRDALLAEARAEAEKKIQEAYQEAYQRGLLQAQEQFAESIGQAAETLAAAAAAIHEARQSFLDSLEPQVVELASLIARRVLQREVRIDAELIHATARRALGKIADRQIITARVHPRDLEALRLHKITLLEDFEGVEELTIEADDTVNPGGCVIESRLMQADARLDTLLSTVLESLAGNA